MSRDENALIIMIESDGEWLKADQRILISWESFCYFGILSFFYQFWEF